ncbi:hypothetical protein ASE74_02490 [Pedobacter sp. Leaf216]|uniref:hypothetical protein n=1 Tax=Pedobacter sp. Leaf216 TaxID=1735684 RepID=UPI0006F941F9|nr:hypothetical protein [Pedobacter sp. Leaf216]KQM74868.1 hypothetical protein ASE74_02490 [Pedobacter sp. Leaf216]
MSIALRNFSLKPFFACLILILFYQVSFAQDVLHKWEVKPYVGIEQARFDWSIAGNTAGTNPNILSELIWKNLKGPGFGLNVKYLITNRLSVKVNNQYSNITKGDAEDTDYADDNRQNAFYFDLLNANKGYLYNADLQFSYQLLTFGQFNIKPIIGVSYNQQKFYLLESANNPDSKGLNSTYQARYKGFDFGSEFIFKTLKFSIGATILAGFYNYSAKANWNLIPDFAKPISFTHKSNSFALGGNVNLSVPLNKSLGLQLDYQLNNIKTYSGVDKAYFNTQPTEETQFNGANFRKNAVLLGLNFSF